MATAAKTTSKPAAKTTSKPTAKPTAKTQAKPTAKPTAKTQAKPTAKTQAKPTMLNNDEKTALCRKLAAKIAPDAAHKSRVNKVLWAMVTDAKSGAAAEKVARFAMTV